MRRGLLVVGVGLIVGLLVWQLGQGLRLPLFDFVEYWAAGRLLSEGHNPYDLDAISQLEKTVDPKTPGVPMLNPPWTMPLVIPFGLLDAHVAHLIWLLIQFAALLGSADLLWRYFGGAADKRWIGWLIGFTFVPSIIALTAGQISPLVLLGVVLFLHAQRAGRPILAGAATLLLAIKPHLVLLVFAALLLDELRRRRLSLLATGAGAGLLSVGVVLTFNSALLGEFWQTLRNPPEQYDSPTLGMVLRIVVGRQHFGLQYIAPVLGMMWIVGHWWRHRHDWQWDERLSLVLLVSLLTAAYGAWLFDLVLLLVPVMEIAARSRHWKAALAIHVVINVIAAVQMALSVEYFWFLWMTPALLLAYLLLRPSDGRGSASVL